MKLVRIFLVPPAFAIVLVVRYIACWRLVRFGAWWYQTRLGHLIGNTECYLAEKAKFHPGTLDFWVPMGKPANKYIARKYRRVLHMMPAALGQVVLTVNRLFVGWERHTCDSEQQDRDIHNLCMAPHISFTEREETKGQALLRSLGIPEGRKWVCLFVRDAAYLQDKAPGADFSYHDYRNSDISECIPAVTSLIARGYYIVRMGDVVAKALNVKHSMVIDYALSGKRTEFADLYLGAHCAFALGSHSGFMAIPQAFQRPVAIINYAPIEYMPTFVRGLLIWKHHMKDGRELSIDEIGDARMYLSGHEFVQAGIKLEDNTAKEIYDLAMQMADEVEGKTQPEKQTKFWFGFPRSYVQGKPLHGEMKLRIGREFLNARLQGDSAARREGEKPNKAAAV